MTTSPNHPKVLHADQEHTGLRTAVMILLFITLLLAFWIIRAMLIRSSPAGDPDYAFIMACGGAFPVALAVVWLAEKLMKQYWPSGRFVTLMGDGIQVQAEPGEPLTLTSSSAIAPLFWHFDLSGWQRGGRERRVPRSWLCLAVELKVGKTQVIVYTYLSRSQAQKWLSATDSPVQFHKISPLEVYDNSIRSRMTGPSRPEIPAAVLTGKDGRYWLAERRRWTEGLELTPKEFELFMNHIQTTLLKW
jgi:hypothetical protein